MVRVTVMAKDRAKAAASVTDKALDKVPAADKGKAMAPAMVPAAGKGVVTTAAADLPACFARKKQKLLDKSPAMDYTNTTEEKLY